jgi:hypothetical protein
MDAARFDRRHFAFLIIASIIFKAILIYLNQGS